MYGFIVIVIIKFGDISIMDEFYSVIDNVFKVGGLWRMDCVIDLVWNVFVKVWLVVFKVVIFFIIGN